MAIKKKKISEYEPGESLKGLWTLGYNIVAGVKKTVRISLDYIHQAYLDAVAATKAANEAADSADKAASSANSAADRANTSATNADKATDRANTAAANADIATGKANTATTAANNAATNANNAASSANQAAGNANAAANRVDDSINKANKAAENADKSAANADRAAGNADKQAGRVQEYADNPPVILDSGNWGFWNETLKKYEDSGILAQGGILYPSFQVDDNSDLWMYYQDPTAEDMFELDDDGCLNLIYRWYE